MMSNRMGTSIRTYLKAAYASLTPAGNGFSGANLQRSHVKDLYHKPAIITSLPVLAVHHYNPLFDRDPSHSIVILFTRSKAESFLGVKQTCFVPSIRSVPPPCNQKNRGKFPSSPSLFDGRITLALTLTSSATGMSTSDHEYSDSTGV